MIGYKDDHAKQFAFIYRVGTWHFTLAYDLLPNDEINGFRTTSINDSIELLKEKENIIAVAVKVGLNKKEAKVILGNAWKVICS